MYYIIVFMIIVLGCTLIDGIVNGMEIFMNLCMLGFKLTSNIIGMVLVISLILCSIF